MYPKFKAVGGTHIGNCPIETNKRDFSIDIDSPIVNGSMIMFVGLIFTRRFKRYSFARDRVVVRL